MQEELDNTYLAAVLQDCLAIDPAERGRTDDGEVEHAEDDDTDVPEGRGLVELRLSLRIPALGPAYDDQHKRPSAEQLEEQQPGLH